MRSGQAEIDHLGVAVVPHHDVLGLDIPVHDPGGMGRGQRLGHLADEVHQLGQGGTPGRERPQRLPLDQLHDEEGLALVLVDVVDRADVGMVQGGGGAGLAPEPLQPLGIPGILLGQELEGDAAAEAGVLGLVDDPHAAAAERLQREVVGEGLADRDRARVARDLRRVLPCRLAAPVRKDWPQAGQRLLLRPGRLGPLRQSLAMRTGEEHGTNSAEQKGDPRVSPNPNLSDQWRVRLLLIDTRRRREISSRILRVGSRRVSTAARPSADRKAAEDASQEPDHGSELDRPPTIPIGLEEIVQAARRLAPWVHRTPVMTSRTLDQRAARPSSSSARIFSASARSSSAER